jgi:hypothetical protein
VLHELDGTLTAVLARALELDPALSREAAAKRVAHLAEEAGMEGLYDRLLNLTSEFTQRGVINPYRLFDEHIRPYFFLANNRPGLLSQVIRDSEQTRDGISQYVVFGHWDSLLILYGSADEATRLMERLQKGAYEDSLRFMAQDILLAFRHRIRRDYDAVPRVSAADINDLALNYDNPSKAELRLSLLDTNLLVGPTLTLGSRSPYPITAFVGILVRARASISGQEVLDALLRQDDLQRCLVDLYQIDHGVPYHYFAKLACATMDELDAATTGVAFASTGGVRFEGETLVVAQGSEQLPLIRKADVSSLMLAPDITPIARRAQRVFEDLGARERASFNSLTDERQLATLRALAGLQSLVHDNAFDPTTQERIESAISTFARESTKSDAGPNLTGAVVEVTSMVETLAKTFLSRLAYSVCGNDPRRIQEELRLPTSKIRSLSLGKVVQALRNATKSEIFSGSRDHFQEEWIDQLESFANERNSWAHGAANGTDTQLIDQAFRAMRDGITIATWLADGIRSITGDRHASQQVAPSRTGTDSSTLRLSPHSRGSDFSVFVSYATADRHTAERITVGLQAMGYNSWYSGWELKGGDSIVAKIQTALSACDVLIVVLSTKSVASSWVNRELSSVLMSQLSGNQVLVVPVLIETCEIPRLLSDTKYVDLREDFEKGFLNILDAIRSHRNEIECFAESEPIDD